MRTKLSILLLAYVMLVGCVTRTTQSSYEAFAPMSVEPPGVAIPDVGGVSVTQSVGSSGLSSDVAVTANAGLPLGPADEPFAELRLGMRGQLASGAVITSSSWGLFSIDLQPPEPLFTAGMGLRVNRAVGPRTHLGVRFSPTLHDTRGGPAMAIDVAAGWARTVGSRSHRPFAELRGQLTIANPSFLHRGGWGGLAGGMDFALARGAIRLRPFVSGHLGRQNVRVDQVITTTTRDFFGNDPPETVQTRSNSDRARTMLRVEVGITVRFGRRPAEPSRGLDAHIERVLLSREHERMFTSCPMPSC